MGLYKYVRVWTHLNGSLEHISKFIYLFSKEKQCYKQRFFSEVKEFLQEFIVQGEPIIILKQNSETSDN